jgi:protochlorophyllide reductase
LSHFLLCSLFLPEMKKVKDARMIIVGSITGNSNTIGGGAVLPLANLGDLGGMRAGSKDPVAMVDGKVVGRCSDFYVYFFNLLEKRGSKKA